MSEASYTAWGEAWKQSGRPPVRLDASTSDPAGWAGRHTRALAKLGAHAALTPADVRALVLGGKLDAAHLAGATETGADGVLVVRDVVNAPTGPEAAALRDQRLFTTATLGRGLSLQLYSSGAVPSPDAAAPTPQTLTFSDPSADAAGWPPVVAVLAIGALAAFAIYQASEVVDRWNARRAQSTQLESAHAHAAALVAAHVQRERDAGRALPLDPATLAALQILEVETRTLAARVEPPRTVVSGDLFSGASFGAAGALAAALAAFFLLKR